MDAPAIEMFNNPLRTVLLEIRQSERRKEQRLKQLESDVQWGQEEAVEKAAKKARGEKPSLFARKDTENN